MTIKTILLAVLFTSASASAELVSIHYVGWDSHKRQEVSGTLRIDTQYMPAYTAGTDRYEIKGAGLDHNLVSGGQDVIGRANTDLVKVVANSGNGARDGYYVQDGYTSVSYPRTEGFDEEVHDIAPSRHYVKLNIYSTQDFLVDGNPAQSFSITSEDGAIGGGQILRETQSMYYPQYVRDYQDQYLVNFDLTSVTVEIEQGSSDHSANACYY